MSDKYETTKVSERIYPTKKVDAEKCCDIIKEEIHKYLGEDDMSNIFKLCETDKPATYSVIFSNATRDELYYGTYYKITGISRVGVYGRETGIVNG